MENMKFSGETKDLNYEPLDQNIVEKIVIGNFRGMIFSFHIPIRNRLRIDKNHNKLTYYFINFDKCERF